MWDLGLPENQDDESTSSRELKILLLAPSECPSEWPDAKNTQKDVKTAHGLWFTMPCNSRSEGSEAGARTDFLLRTYFSYSPTGVGSIRGDVAQEAERRGVVEVETAG